MLRAKLIGKKQVAKTVETNNSTNQSSAGQQALATTGISPVQENQLQQRIKQLEIQLQEQAQLLQSFVQSQKQPTNMSNVLVTAQVNNGAAATSALDKSSLLPTSRRGLLKKLGIAMAGAASVTTVVSSFEATKAHAASGDNLLVGNSNLAGNTTYISQKGNVSDLDDKALLWADWNSNGKSPKPTVNSAIAGTADGAAVGGYFKGGQAPLLLAPGTGQGAPSSGTHLQGELYVDNQGELYLCQNGSNPGPIKWAKITGSSGSTINPRQIATKRWFEANQSYSSVDIPGPAKKFIFDGTNMWILVGSIPIIMTKMDAANLTSIASQNTQGPGISDLVFTGTNIIYQSGRNGLGRIKLSDASVISTYAIVAAANPNPSVSSIAYDGKYVWASAVQKIIRTDLVSETIYNHASLTSPYSSLYADGFLWVTNEGAGNNLFKFNVANGSLVATYNTGGDTPRNLTFDGTHLWAIHDSGTNIITKTRTSDGVVVGIVNSVADPMDMVFDGYYIWVCSPNGITKLQASTGSVLGTYVAVDPTTNNTKSNFTCIGFDGHRVWAGNGSNYSAWIF
jgi:hypothetical protein